MPKNLSPKFKEIMKVNIARWYNQGQWDETKVKNAVKNGILTQDEADNILGGSKE